MSNSRSLSRCVLSLLPLLAGAIGILVTSAPASAHIRLLEPEARYEITGVDMGIKSCPCGLGGSNRTCDVAADGSDPARDESKAITVQAGSMLTLRFEEYIAHSGRYRIAFDPDGADFADFNDHILLDEPDPSGSMGNSEDGSEWTFTVTVPSEPCDNCTLQLIQVMNNNTTTPVTDPADMSTYYTCIDLKITAGGAPTGSSTAAMSSSDVPVMPSMSAAPMPSDMPAASATLSAAAPMMSLGMPSSSAASDPVPSAVASVALSMTAPALPATTAAASIVAPVMSSAPAAPVASSSNAMTIPSAATTAAPGTDDGAGEEGAGCHISRVRHELPSFGAIAGALFLGALAFRRRVRS